MAFALDKLHACLLTTLHAAFQHLPQDMEEEKRRWFMRGLRYEVRKFKACVGAAVIAQINPAPIPEIIQRVCKAVQEDDMRALNPIKFALSHIPVTGAPAAGWWISNRPFPAVFPAETYDEHQAIISRTRSRVKEGMRQCEELAGSLEQQAEEADEAAMEVDSLRGQLAVLQGTRRDGPPLHW